MATDNSNAFRARASQARRISDTMNNREAQTELRLMADELDAEADRLDNDDCSEPIPPGADISGDSV